MLFVVAEKQGRNRADLRGSSLASGEVFSCPFLLTSARLVPVKALFSL